MDAWAYLSHVCAVLELLVDAGLGLRHVLEAEELGQDALALARQLPRQRDKEGKRTSDGEEEKG